MARTTVDIEAPILSELKRLGREEGVTLGQLVSRLLAEALDDRERGRKRASLQWNSKPMTALVDIADKEAVYAALDRDDRSSRDDRDGR